MIYKPHILFQRIKEEQERDEYGRPIGKSEETWKKVCPCRCDDNTTQKFTSENGTLYQPAYHVVCEGIIDIKAGDEVRCMDKDEVRGEGKVTIVKHTNYYRYTEIWM